MVRVIDAMSIRIKGLKKKFGSFVAVHGVDIEVPEGKMLVLLGPSGCGKTTTMRCIAGLEAPTEGIIELGGQPVFDSERRINVPVNHRNVGMVFQSYAIWPHMTVTENVAFPLKMQKLPTAEVEERVAEILRIVGLEQFRDRGATSLSGGQMQRVALARSLVMRPAVLLFDEPLSNLDARLRDHLRVELRELQTRFNITSVFVTHDQSEALSLADQIAVMNTGRVLQADDPVTIYQNPHSSVVADFIGYRNIFPGAVRQGGDDGILFALDESSFELTSVHPPPPGEGGIFACVRPEDFEIEAHRPDQPVKPNTFIGEVTSASFMGSYTQYRVRSTTGQVIDVFHNRAPLDLLPGSPARLHVAPKSVLLLPMRSAS